MNASSATTKRSDGSAGTVTPGRSSSNRHGCQQPCEITQSQEDDADVSDCGDTDTTTASETVGGT